MSLANWVPRSRRKLVSQRLHAARASKRIALGPDAETLRRRALHDARGQRLREGHTYRAAGVTHWQVVRSRLGRIDQRDVIVNGQLHKTCGPRRLPAWLR